MIGIVVVIYKSIDETIRFINQEIRKIKLPYKLVIVNNSGTNEDSQYLAQKCNATLVDNNKKYFSNNHFVITIYENVGYAKGNNVGVEFLTKYFEIDYILFCNNDIKIPYQKNGIEVLIKKLEDTDDIGIIGPQILGLDNIDQSPHIEISFARYFGWIAFSFLRKKMDKSKLTKTNEAFKMGYCYWVSGSFFIVKTIDFINAGMFDSHTFLYGEEKMLSERMLRIKKHCFYDSSFRIIHVHGGTTSHHLIKKKIDEMVFLNDCYYFQQYKNVSPLLIVLLKLIYSLKNH
jgi:GT2 family glycosyltransferase